MGIDIRMHSFVGIDITDIVMAGVDFETRFPEDFMEQHEKNLPYGVDFLQSRTDDDPGASVYLYAQDTHYQYDITYGPKNGLLVNAVEPDWNTNRLLYVASEELGDASAREPMFHTFVEIW